MNIIVIPGANVNMAEHQDEFLTLPVKARNVTVDVGDGSVDNVPAMSSAWKPTRSELAMLLDGGYIELTILGTQHPPIMLNVEPEIREEDYLSESEESDK